jgi:hypothetical protein
MVTLLCAWVILIFVGTESLINSLGEERASFSMSLASDMMGALAGVSLALQVDTLLEEGRNKKKRQTIITDLKIELRRALEAVVVTKGNILPMDNWKSCVSSGELRLLTPEQRSRLSEVYYRIEVQNYESTRVADARDKALSLPQLELDIPPFREYNAVRAFWQQLSTRNTEMEKETTFIIEEALKWLGT